MTNLYDSNVARPRRELATAIQEVASSRHEPGLTVIEIVNEINSMVILSLPQIQVG